MSAHARIYEGNCLVKMGMRHGEALLRYTRALESAEKGGAAGTLPSMCRENIRHIQNAR